MNRYFRTLLTGGAVAFGLVSTAALAQRAEPAPEAAGSQMIMNSDGAAELAMPQGDMMAMMENCEKMMERMDATSGSDEMPNPPQRQ